MTSFLKKSLELKIVVALGLILTLLLGLASVIDIYYESEDSYGVVFKQLEALANTIQKSLIKDMREGNSSDVQQIIEAVGTEKGIVAVRIFDVDGRVLKSSARAEIGKKIPETAVMGVPSRNRSFITEDGGYKIFHIVHPIPNAPPCYGCHDRDKEVNGILELDYSLESVQRTLYSHIIRMAGVFVLSIFLVGLAIYLLLKVLVNDPIKSLKSAMSDAESGNLDVTIPVGSEDEIGSLQGSFNSMLSRIKGLNQENLKQQRDLVKKEEELRMREALAEQNRALEYANLEISEKNRYYMEMLSFISHELKNPLVVLKGYSTLLLGGELGALELPQREALSAVDRNVDALQEMIANYMDLSRLERGELKFEKRPVDLVEDVVKPVMAEYAGSLDKASMSIRMEGAEGPVMVQGDPGLLKSAVANLVSNAIKYGWRGTDLVVEVDAGEEGVRLSVYNEGQGIPFEDLERVFERFTRLDNEGTRSQKGTGLGLYIVSEIARLHGGRAWAESREGVWTKIAFTLPNATHGD